MHCIRLCKSWLTFSLSFCPESSLLIAADPFISSLRLPDEALMPRHSIGMQPCPDQAKLLCARVHVSLYWCCSSSTPLWRCLAGQTADPMSLAGSVDNSWVDGGHTRLQLMWCRGFGLRAVVYSAWTLRGEVCPLWVTCEVSSFVTWLRSNLGVGDVLFLSCVGVCFCVCA